MDRDKGLTVGQKLYFELEDRGYKTVRIPDRVLKQYVFHLAHATQVVNQKQYNLQRRTIKKIQKRIKAIMESELIRSILSEDSLDC